MSTHALDGLRSYKKMMSANQLRISLSVVDPLNLMGILLPGKRVTGNSTKQVIIDSTQLLSQ